jgi:hypothetical protein
MFHYLQKALRKRRPKEFIVYNIEPDSDFDYLKLASACRTQNAFNRLHIGLENICTPLEVAEIAKLASSSKSPEAIGSWLKKFRLWIPELFDAPQGYVRRTFSRHVILYQNPERAVCDKGLLVAFSGNARRLSMPVSVFLQFVDSRSWDVVVLKKCSRGSYLLGLEGVSNNFRGLVEYLQTALSSMQYRRVITLGTSAGGFAATWAAVLMGAERGISLSGCPPNALPSPTIGDQPAPNGADLCFVYGMDSAPDHQSALALLDLFGGRLRPVAGIDTHNVIGQLMKRGQFAEFIDEMLA